MMNMDQLLLEMFTLPVVAFVVGFWSYSRGILKRLGLLTMLIGAGSGFGMLMWWGMIMGNPTSRELQFINGFRFIVQFIALLAIVVTLWRNIRTR